MLTGLEELARLRAEPAQRAAAALGAASLHQSPPVYGEEGRRAEDATDAREQAEANEWTHAVAAMRTDLLLLPGPLQRPGTLPSAGTDGVHSDGGRLFRSFDPPVLAAPATENS
jgi:hypothetical protein